MKKKKNEEKFENLDEEIKKKRLEVLELEGIKIEDLHKTVIKNDWMD